MIIISDKEHLREREGGKDKEKNKERETERQKEDIVLKQVFLKQNPTLLLTEL